jgi:MFS family permease
MEGDRISAFPLGFGNGFIGSFFVQREPIPQVTRYLRLGGKEWSLPAALGALHHRNYRLYWAGQLISLIGTWMQSTAQQWLVYRITGSPAMLGVVTFLNSLPALLLSLFAGVVVDRVDKRKALVFTQVAMMLLAFVLAALAVTNTVQYWHILVLATLLGTVNTFDMSLRQAFTVEMVGKEDLMNAIALNSSILNGARLIGPAVAGLLVAAVGEAAAFGLNGLSFVAVIAGLLMMVLPAHTPRADRPNPFVELRDGLSYMGGNRTVMALGVVAALPSIFGFSYSTLIPVMAAQVLGLGADGYGWLVSAIGFGALIAALSLAALGGYRRKGRLLTLATFVFVGALAGFALSRSIILSLAALALAGWAMVTHLATTNTLLQLEIPDALRGRVMGAYIWCVAGTAPLGAVFYGQLAQLYGAPFTILVGAAICAVSAVAVLVFFPHVRRLA